MGISADYQDIVKSAVNGHYEDTFFGTLDPDQPPDSDANMRRLRAAVQHLNLQFASLMRQYGHRSKIEDENGNIETIAGSPSDMELEHDYSQFKDQQETISRADAVKRVRNKLVRSRGRELPGTFNPLLISQLFWEQSGDWEAMALFHIEKVAAVCEVFVHAAIKHTVTADVSTRIQALKVDGALQTRLADSKSELSRIIKDKKRHPITYDPAYTTIVRKLRNKNHTAKMQALVQKAQRTITDYNKQTKDYLDPNVVQSGIEDVTEPDMDKTSAEDALDSQLAYYKVSSTASSPVEASFSTVGLTDSSRTKSNTSSPSSPSKSSSATCSTTSQLIPSHQ